MANSDHARLRAMIVHKTFKPGLPDASKQAFNQPVQRKRHTSHNKILIYSAKQTRPAKNRFCLSVYLLFARRKPIGKGVQRLSVAIIKGLQRRVRRDA